PPSWIGWFVHHFLEPMLVFGILWGTLAVGRWPLAVFLTAAMFVQTALVIAAGLSFAVLFLMRKRAALAFAVPALAIALYRLTRPPGYPNSQWFLGWTHAALFAGAAVALSFRRRWLGLALGVLIPLLALAGAIYAGKRVVLALLVAVPPPLQLAGWLMTSPMPAVQPEQRPWIAKAEWLRRQPPGRVLAPWSMGHALDVIGEHAVII